MRNRRHFANEGADYVVDWAYSEGRLSATNTKSGEVFKQNKTHLMSDFIDAMERYKDWRGPNGDIWRRIK